MTELSNGAALIARGVDDARVAYANAAGLPWFSAPQAAVFDARGETLSTSGVSALCGLTASVAAIRAFFGDKWQRGDVAITNDPDTGAATACEMTVVAPIWCSDGPPRYWAALRAFVPDIGGWELGGYSPQAVDRWAEGARFEPAKIVLAGRQRREVADMLMLNSRTPKLTRRCVLALVDAVRELGDSIRNLDAAQGATGVSAQTRAAYAKEIERVDRCLSSLGSRVLAGASAARIPFADLVVDPINVTLKSDSGGLSVTVSAPPVAPRPINLAPVATDDLVTAAIAAALGLEGLRTDAIRKRVRVQTGLPSLAAAPLPAPVCLGRATAGQAVFAATIMALSEGGVRADASSLWSAYRAAHDDGALDPSSGKITSARAAAIRAREAEEARA